MWLNSIRCMTDDKPLSAVELLVLAIASEQAINASGLVEKLNNQTLMWRGAPGTLYPLLHRLHNRGLLDKSGDRGTDFKRTEVGQRLLNHSLNPIKNQIKESNNYYITLIDLLMELENAPMGIHDFMDEIESETMKFLDDIKSLKEKGKSVKDDSVDVKIDFD